MSHDVWAAAHLEAMRRGLSAPSRAAEMVAYCESMAQAYPPDAYDWLREAATYKGIFLRHVATLDDGWRDVEERVVA